MSRELLEKCYAAIETLCHEFDTIWAADLMTEIEAELIKPEPQPAWYSVDNNGEGGAVIFYPTLDQAENSSSVLDYGEEIIPLYTHPPRQQEPLDTDILDQLHFENEDDPIAFARAIEEAHGIGGRK